MSQPPTLSIEARRAALLKAAEHRKIRAIFKEQVRIGKRSWVDALESQEEAIARMRIKELLESIPGFGNIRSLAILDKLGISHSRRIQGLGTVQKENLRSVLKGR